LFLPLPLDSLTNILSFSKISISVLFIMRKLCPNIDREDGLETVLEIPIPEEMYTNMGSNAELRWQNMLTWMRAQTSDKLSQPVIAARINELRFLLYMVGSPLIPLQVQVGHSVHKPVKDCSIVRGFYRNIHISLKFLFYTRIIVYRKMSNCITSIAMIFLRK